MLLTFGCCGTYRSSYQYWLSLQTSTVYNRWCDISLCSELHDISIYYAEILSLIILGCLTHLDHYTIKGNSTRTRAQRIFRQARSSRQVTIAVSWCHRADRHMFSERGRRISTYVPRSCIEGLCHCVYNKNRDCTASHRRCSTARHYCMASTISRGLYGISLRNAEV